MEIKVDEDKKIKEKKERKRIRKRRQWRVRFLKYNGYEIRERRW